jgi:hypothetical protein
MNSKKCSNCGLVNFPTESVCKRCKSPLSATAPGGEWSHTFGLGAQTAPKGGAPRAQASVASDGLYYKPSGEVTLAGLGAGLLGGLLVGLVLAFVYSYLIAYIPFIYLNILCTVGYTFALGFVIGWLLKSGKMRNPVVGVFAAVAVSLISYYFCWAIWLSAMLARSDVDISALALATHPGALLDLILRVNEKGAWTLGRGGTPVTGVFLWVIWGAEALIVLVGPPLIAWGVLSSEPFCESCGEWCDEDHSLVSLARAEPAELRRVFESKEFERLKSVGAKEDGAQDWYRLDLHRCKRCDRTNTLTVKSEKITFDSKGNSKVRSTDLFSKLVLAPTEIEELRRVSRELTRPAPAPSHAHAPQAPAAQV